MEKASLITRISDGFCKVEKTVTWIAFAIMLALLLIQVICRYVFAMPLAWAEEMVRYTYIAVSFIGAIVAVRERSHIGIDIILSIIKKVAKGNEKKEQRMLDALDVFDDVVQIAFFSILSAWLLEYNIEIAEANQITTANEWPMWLMCLPVTVSLMLMALHSLMNLIESVVDMRRIRKAGAN